MNKKLKEFRRIRALQSIPRSEKFGNKRNCVKFWKGTSYEHFRVMSDIVWKLANQGYECFTEVTMRNGKRADIIAVSLNGEVYAIEVLKSEPEARYEAKLDSYPIEYTLVRVECKDFDINKWEL